MATRDEINAQLQAQYATIADRLGSYETRRNANIANIAKFQEACACDEAAQSRQRSATVVVTGLDPASELYPHATVGDYIVEPNPGPKTGYRPTYFFDLDRAADLVTVTVSGDVLVPAPGSFSYSAVDIDPTQPLADFLAAVVAGLGVQTEIVFFTAREDTCLGIVGQTGYELGTVTVTVQ